MTLDLYYYNSSQSGTGSGGGYDQAVLDLSPIAYWPLISASGTDIGGGGYDLTPVASPTTLTGPFADLTPATDFEEASDQHMTVTNAALRPTTGLTVAAWVNAESSGTDRGIVSCGDTGFEGYRLTQASDTVIFQVKNGTDTPADVTTVATSITTDGSAWQFIVGTYNQVEVNAYVNGTIDSNSPTAATFAIGYSSNALYVANWDGNATRDFDGGIAGVAVWDRALTGSEISGLYTAAGF